MVSTPAASARRHLLPRPRPFAVCTLVYGGLVALGLEWATVNGAVSPVWPAAGFALAALTLLGLRYWPFVPVGLYAAMWLQGDANPLAVQLAFAAGNTLAAVAATLALRRLRTGARRPASVRLLLALIVAGVGVGAVLAASAGTAALALAGVLPREAWADTWLTWWLGDAAGIVVVAPLVFAWRRGALPPLAARERLHLAACLVAIAAGAWLVFASPWSSQLRTWHVLPLLVWAALAFQVRGVSAALAIVAALATHGATVGSGLFAPPGASLAEVLHYVQQYLLLMGVALLLLAELSDGRRAEARIAASEERYRLALTAIQGHVYDFDVGTGEVRRTARFYDLLGYRAEDVPATAAWWRAQCEPGDFERLQAATTAAIRAGAPTVEVRYRARHRDGRWIWVWDRTAFVRDAAGRVTRAVGSVVDVTAEMEAAAALAASEQRYRSLVDAITSVVFTVDASGRFVERHPSWEAYTGQDWNASRGMGWLDAVHPDDRERIARASEAVRAAPAPYLEHGRLWHAASGTWRRFETRAVPLARDGAVHEWIGTILDVEDRLHALEELQAADRRKDEFLATLAHELRNPLAPIRHATRILDSPQAGAREQEWCRNVIRRQVEHMALLLDDLLDVSRITRGRLELKRRRIVLRTAVEAAVETARPLIDARRHRLAVTLPDVPVPLDADPLRLAQILANLLTNAAKYTDPGGAIELEATVRDGRVAVAVRDDGIGLDADALGRVFEMFTQIEQHGDRADGGLGIGLALVKGLVELHDGSVEARSAGPGRGSEFVVRLPLAAAPPLHAGEGGEPCGAPPHAAAGRRVLVADDNVDAAESLAMLLRQEGHEVRVVHDGAAALASCTDWRPDYALLDIGMPGIDGYEVAQRLRRESRDARVRLFALTGWGQQEDRQAALAAGFDRHLTKPVDPVEVLALLADEPRRAVG